MSGEKEFSEYWKKLQERYPTAYMFFDLVNNNFRDIYNDVLSNTPFANDEMRRISLYAKKGMHRKVDLLPTKESMILLMAISESLMQLLAKFLDPQGNSKNIEKIMKIEFEEKDPKAIEDTVNMCICGHINDIVDIYCSKCGEKLLQS